METSSVRADTKCDFFCGGLGPESVVIGNDAPATLREYADRVLSV